MTGHIPAEEFGDAPWALLATSAARREALVAALDDEYERRYGCGATLQELDDDFAEAAEEHGFRFNGIHWED